MIKSIADLVSFLRRFHSHLGVEPSTPEGLIPADLPASLATIYRDVGGLVELDHVKQGLAPFGAQDRLVPISRLKKVNGMFEFAWENQGNWSARCSPGPGNPPVYSNAPDLWNVEQRGFVQLRASLEQFLTTLCLQEAVLSCRDLLQVVDGPSPTEILDTPPRPLWTNGCYVADQPDHNFWHLEEGNIVVMEHSEGLMVGSPSVDVRLRLATGMKAKPLR
jgi:hypothetical protein